jgi:hypothetical protein
MKTKPLAFLLALTFLFLFSCAATLNSTTVSSIAIAPVELGSSVHILLPDAMIESKKVREYLRNELNKLGFSKGEYDNSKVILTFLVKFLGSKKHDYSFSTPVYGLVIDPATGVQSQIVTGYNQHFGSYTTNANEIRIQFHNGELFRKKDKNSILWEAVGKKGGFSPYILKKAPYMVTNILTQLNKNSDAKNVLWKPDMVIK